MVQIIKELGLDINEELWEDDVAMAFFTELFMQGNESPGEQKAWPAPWLLLHFTCNPACWYWYALKELKSKSPELNFSAKAPKSKDLSW